MVPAHTATPGTPKAKFIDSDPEQSQIYPIRVYGTAQMPDCDHVVIKYTFEIQYLDENGEPVWDTFDKGEADETRLKVHIPDLQ